MRQKTKKIHVAELFAGVGGFRLGLEEASTRFETVFVSQWEPPGTAKKQFAARCYQAIWGNPVVDNKDIAESLNEFEQNRRPLPRVDLLCGGFPCQDYSVAKPMNQSEGLRGKKGVLWWQIHRMVKLYKDRKTPIKYLVLENVDRLLSSPANQRGRDFAVVIRSLTELGYVVEWRVINAKDYGRSQKRRRVFIVAYFPKTKRSLTIKSAEENILKTGVLVKAFPVTCEEESLVGSQLTHFTLDGEVHKVSQNFGVNIKTTQFKNAGVASGCNVWTMTVAPENEPFINLGDVIKNTRNVDASLFLRETEIPKWRYLKGKKGDDARDIRINKKTGATYQYKEGELPFPENLEDAARTILTSEWGSSPSRTRHVVEDRRGFSLLDAEKRKGLYSGGYRRLTIEELETLNDFPINHTRGPVRTPLSPQERAFCMGNALVVGLVKRIGEEIARLI